MTHLKVNKGLLSTLKDKVVVITGGATGMGKAAVTLLFSDHGAKVVSGDVNDQLSQELVSQSGRISATSIATLHPMRINWSCSLRASSFTAESTLSLAMQEW